MQVNRLFFSSRRIVLLSSLLDPRGEARQLRLAPAPRSRRRARHGSRVWPCDTRGVRGVRAVRGLSVRAHGRARCALCAVVSFSFVRRRLLAPFRAPLGGREARRA